MHGKSGLTLMVLAALMLTGCAAMRPDDTLAGDVGAYNHTAKAINWYTVNGAGSGNIHGAGKVLVLSHMACFSFGLVFKPSVF